MQFQHNFLEFEELSTKAINGKRHYAVNGQFLPSVTTVLSSRKNPALDAWKKRMGEEKANQIRDAAATRGTGMHELLEQYVLNKDIDFRKAMPTHIELFQAIQKTLDKSLGKIYGIEAPLYSLALGVAGRLDLCADWEDEPAIIDFKSSLRRKKREWMEGYFMQESIYSYMMFERHGLYVPKLVTIVANEEDPSEAEVFVERAGEWLPKAVDVIKNYFDLVANGELTA